VLVLVTDAVVDTTTLCEAAQRFQFCKHEAVKNYFHITRDSFFSPAVTGICRGGRFCICLLAHAAHSFRTTHTIIPQPHHRTYNCACDPNPNDVAIILSSDDRVVLVTLMMIVTVLMVALSHCAAWGVARLCYYTTIRSLLWWNRNRLMQCITLLFVCQLCCSVAPSLCRHSSFVVIRRRALLCVVRSSSLLV